MRSTFLSEVELPPLSLEQWEDTKETLHRYCQIVGKVRMELSAFRNHWWHVTLYVTPRGLTTGPIPYSKATFEISFNLLENRLVVTTSEGELFGFAIDNLPVAEFYSRLMGGLDSLEIDVSINTEPFDLDDEHTLASDTYHRSWNRSDVQRYHRVLTWTDQVFKEFAGRFNGKQSPVQLFWHGLDLAVTRFSGRRAPERPDADKVTREAYSHEVISCGFWPGDKNVQEPAFYSPTRPRSRRASQSSRCAQTRRTGPLKEEWRSSGTRRCARVTLRRQPCWSLWRAPTRRERRPRTGTSKTSGHDPGRVEIGETQARLEAFRDWRVRPGYIYFIDAVEDRLARRSPDQQHRDVGTLRNSGGAQQGTVGWQPVPTPSDFPIIFGNQLLVETPLGGTRSTKEHRHERRAPRSWTGSGRGASRSRAQNSPKYLGKEEALTLGASQRRPLFTLLPRREILGN